MEDSNFDEETGWGVAVLVGVPHKDAVFKTHPVNFLTERTLKGTFYGHYKPRTDLAVVFEMYMNKEIELEKFINHEVSFSEINKAFDLMLQGIIHSYACLSPLYAIPGVVSVISCCLNIAFKSPKTIVRYHSLLRLLKSLIRNSRSCQRNKLLFKHCIQISKDHSQTEHTLHYIKQGQHGSLRDYLKRVNVVAMEIPNLDPHVQLFSVKHELKPEHFADQIALAKPKDMTKIQEKVVYHMEIEEF
ncbi:alcohol dehydrogenase 3-like [Canna indica]|uniref:alcohol dehydrogenase n=1 Tax=Canna indica TaxID=4628 RepID=A0AAQ3K4I1_9LILI|nr:alcohol dehydrogenase 3-like [Canna indica]